MKNTTKAVFMDCLRRFRLPAALVFFHAALCCLIFRLYGLMTEPFRYALVLTLSGMAVSFCVCFVREKKKAERRRQKSAGVLTEWNSLPEADTLAEADYREMIETLGREKEKLAAAFAAERKETQDFYTAWVHQIKTPIAVMKLALDSSDTPDRRALREELFRIEQYTEMVLAFQRLGSSSNDLVIREYALDGLIREVIRKYASQFISKKLRLVYDGADCRVVTDRKWFLCILEQLISNAVKYTPAGSVTVAIENGVLSVADTGIGISPEDLPRIFEKGYTGVNGRLSDKSSGLGLYLCGEAAALLNIPITAKSSPGKGSCFLLCLSDKIV